MTFALVISVIMANKRLKFVETFQLSMFGTFTISVYILYLVVMPKVEILEFIRTYQNFLNTLTFIVSGNFLVTDWLPHFLMR